MTRKEVSILHENWIARLYNGDRSRSSGASAVDKSDVRTNDDTMFECKATGTPGGDSKYTTLIRQMEKIADDAWAEGKEPAVALRYFCPESPLSDVNGWVDFTVRLSIDDARRANNNGD